MSAAAGRAGAWLSGLPSGLNPAWTARIPRALPGQLLPRELMGRARKLVVRLRGPPATRRARLRSKPPPTLPVGAFAFGREGVSRPIEGLDSVSVPRVRFELALHLQARGRFASASARSASPFARRGVLRSVRTAPWVSSPGTACRSRPRPPGTPAAQRLAQAPQANSKNNQPCTRTGEEAATFTQRPFNDAKTTAVTASTHTITAPEGRSSNADSARPSA